MRKSRKNSKASQGRKAVPPSNREAKPVTGQDRAEQSEDQALAEEVEGSLGLYLEDILRKVAEIEEDALESDDQNGV